MERGIAVGHNEVELLIRRADVLGRSSSTSSMVELRGLEPLTPCLQSRCATNCATAPSGRSDRVGRLRPGVLAGRTAAPEHESTRGHGDENDDLLHGDLPGAVGLAGLEPATSSLSGKRSNQAEL